MKSIELQDYFKSPNLDLRSTVILAIFLILSYKREILQAITPVSTHHFFVNVLC